MNEYLELKIMKARSLLYYIHDRNQKDGIRMFKIYENRFTIINSWKEKDTPCLLIEVSNIIEYLNEVIKLKNNL